MAIINVYNKARNTTYVYDSFSYWDKELKQPRSKRKLIGKRDPETGEIIPTGPRGRSKKEASNSDTDFQALYENLLKTSNKQSETITDLQARIHDLEQDNRNLRSAISKAHNALSSVSETR